jgi:hypothetical protein
VRAAAEKALPNIVSLEEGIVPLKQAFARVDGKPRYLALVSPT